MTDPTVPTDPTGSVPTDPTDPVPTDPTDPSAASSVVEHVFRTSLRHTMWFLGVLTVVGVGLGWIFAGTEGVWGALIGVGLALVFSGTTVIAMLRTVHSSPPTMAAVVMGTWLAKVFVVIIVLALIRDLDFYSKPALAGVLLVGVLGSAYLDYRAVYSARLPYVEPGSAPSTPDPDGQ